MYTAKNRAIGIFVAILFSVVLSSTVHARLDLKDIKSLQAELEARNATFTVGTNSATERDLENLCGLVPPPQWWKEAPFKEMKRRGLPSSFNWCNQGGCAPVRNQGACGSCWAFATVGPLECNILIAGGDSEDLSEQYLVSCNSNGWGCGGGWWAHDYHQWKYSAPETEAGAVPEAAFSYAAWDAPCGGPYAHPWKIQSWAYVGVEGGPIYDIPLLGATVDAIKQAIMDYGPVAVALYTGPAFQAYTGGIFNTHETGVINHAVVLVGWDDEQGANGVWFLRNSWGSGWGEGGYMRIEYGISQVGYSANYIEYGQSGCTEDDSGALDLKGGSYPPGGEANVVVRVQGAPNVADSLGLEVVFDNSALAYTGFTKGALVEGWSFFDVTNPEPGIVRIGGFTTANEIASGSSGDLVTLTFDVNCDQDFGYKMELQQLKNDVAAWSVSPGCYDCGCSCDVNGDADVTPGDALCAFQTYLGVCPTNCGPCDEICCDVNMDSDCTPGDALEIFKDYLGLGSVCSSE